jgi:hypothetical protein
MKWSHEAVHKLTHLTERRLTDNAVNWSLDRPDHHASILAKTDNPQRSSPLWSKLPAELRGAIFALVPADPEDPHRGRQYNNTIRFVRPLGTLAREDDLPLLRSCRAAYRECWLDAVVLRERKYWISGTVDNFNVRPKDARADYVLPRVLDRLGVDKIEVRSLRVFARTTELYGGDLAKLLSNELLHPRSVTLVIRPRCWPIGPDNVRTFKARWIRDAALRMSPSTREFRVELGCYRGWRRDIDHFAQVMRERWFLVRADDTLMFADCSGQEDQETASWTETSTKHNLRPWLANPRQFPEDHHYYMNTIIFRLEEDLGRRGDVISEQARLRAEKYQSEEQQTKRWMKRRLRSQPSPSSSEASDEDFDGEMDLSIPATVDREDQTDGPMGPVPSAKSRKQEARLVAVSNDLSWWMRSWRYNVLYLIAVGVVPVAVCMALGVGLCRLGMWCVFG